MYTYKLQIYMYVKQNRICDSTKLASLTAIQQQESLKKSQRLTNSLVPTGWIIAWQCGGTFDRLFYRRLDNF